ncbi:MAG: 4-hydroxy-tetrahydrodipicolinate reductase [Opitutales bacterium]
MAIRVLLNGAKGRMGRAILQAAEGNAALEIIAALDQGDALAKHLEGCDVAVDFSHHTATAPLGEAAARLGKAVVIGTTGHDAEERERIDVCTQSIPIVWAGNYSIGVNLLLFLVEKAAGTLSEAYEPEVFEMHHRHKVDAPSGTAENLIQTILQARGWSEDTVQHGRSGITGERPARQLGVHALRGGEIVGEHTVFFTGEGERLELTHRAYDRQIFAQGALAAALWVTGKPAGLYAMRDVLGLNG